MLDTVQLLRKLNAIEPQLDAQRDEVPVIGGGGGGVGGAGVAGQVAYWTAVNTIGGEAAFTYNAGTNTLTAQNIIVSGIAGPVFAYPDAASQFTALANAAGYLYNNGAGVFSYIAVPGAVAHNLLSATHSDTTPAAVVRGDVITGQGLAPTWSSLAISVPAATFRNYLGTANGDTEPGYKALFDANVPTTIVAGAAAATGASTVAARRDHTHGAPATYPATSHSLLDDVYHGDTTTAAVARGDLITGQGVATTWASLAISVPAANVRNVLGVDNGDTEPAWKTALDANNPATLTAAAAAAPGTSLIFAHRDHVHQVTNTSDGDTTPSTILSTDANGTLRVRRLGVGAAAVAVNGTIILPDGGYIGRAINDLRELFDTTNGYIDHILGDAAGGDEVRTVDSGGGVVHTVDSDGNGYFAGDVGIAETPTVRLDVGQTVNEFSIIFGADNAASDTRTDATRKFARIGSPHYTNAEEPVTLAVVDSDTAYSAVNIGGSTSSGNAATLVRFYTAANTTTLTGTERMRINSSGDVGIATTSPDSRLDIADGALTMAEMVAPGAPAANGAVIYAVDNGAGKTQLMVRFQSGAAQQIAIEP